MHWRVRKQELSLQPVAQCSAAGEHLSPQHSSPLVHTARIVAHFRRTIGERPPLFALTPGFSQVKCFFACRFKVLLRKSFVLQRHITTFVSNLSSSFSHTWSPTKLISPKVSFCAAILKCSPPCCSTTRRSAPSFGPPITTPTSVPAINGTTLSRPSASPANMGTSFSRACSSRASNSSTAPSKWPRSSPRPGFAMHKTTSSTKPGSDVPTCSTSATNATTAGNRRPSASFSPKARHGKTMSAPPAWKSPAAKALIS